MKHIMKAVLERKLDFIGYPDYSVDTDGNVWSHKCGKVRKMTCTESDKGYSYVYLWNNNGIQKTLRVHRLVALAFIPNPDNKPCIDHINTNRSDNRVCNLRWCTVRENNNNPITCSHISEALKGKYCGVNNSNAKAVLQYTKDGQFVAEYSTMKEAAQLTNVNNGNITNCCKGKIKTCGGYIWKYK